MMTHRTFSMILSFSLVLLLLVGGVRCTKDLAIDNNDTSQPLSLRMTVEDGTPIFSWDAINHSDFRRYIILRSNKNVFPLGSEVGVFNELPRLFHDARLIRIATVTDMLTLSASDKATDIIDTSYYKLYVDLGDKVSESNSVVFVQEHTTFVGGLGSLIDKDSSWVILAYSGKISVYDYVRNQVLGEIPATLSPLIAIMMMIGIENGEKVLYVGQSGFGLKRFSLPELNVLSGIPLSDYVTGGGFVHKNTLIYTVNLPSSRALVLKRQTTLEDLEVYCERGKTPKS